MENIIEPGIRFANDEELKRYVSMKDLIEPGTRFASEEDLKKYINEEPLFHPIYVVVYRRAKNQLEVHGSTHCENESEELLSNAKAVAEQLNDDSLPYII